MPTPIPGTPRRRHVPIAGEQSRQRQTLQEGRRAHQSSEPERTCSRRVPPLITVLFASSRSIYKRLGCDVWDKQRDALKWPGGTPAIFHPPCARWSRLRHMAQKDDADLAPWAVDQIRRWGGVLEHPQSSILWKHKNLPTPGQHDKYGWTLAIQQWDWGHQCRKNTWLYIVGLTPQELPAIPLRLGQSQRDATTLNSEARSATPPALAEWLIQTCRAITQSQQYKQHRADPFNSSNGNKNTSSETYRDDT